MYQLFIDQQPLLIWLSPSDSLIWLELLEATFPKSKVELWQVYEF